MMWSAPGEYWDIFVVVVCFSGVALIWPARLTGRYKTIISLDLSIYLSHCSLNLLCWSQIGVIPLDGLLCKRYVCLHIPQMEYKCCVPVWNSSVLERPKICFVFFPMQNFAPRTLSISSAALQNDFFTLVFLLCKEKPKSPTEDIELNGMIRRMTTKGSDVARQLKNVLDRLNAARQRRPEVGLLRSKRTINMILINDSLDLVIGVGDWSDLKSYAGAANY